MYFAMHGHYRWRTEAERKRAFTMYGQWTSPESVEIVSSYQRCDGRGFVNIVKTDDPAALLKVASATAPYVEIDVIPIIPYSDGVPALTEIVEWAERLPNEATKPSGGSHPTPS